MVQNSSIGRRVAANCVEIAVPALSLFYPNRSAAKAAVICEVNCEGESGYLFFAHGLTNRDERGRFPLLVGTDMASISNKFLIYSGN